MYQWNELLKMKLDLDLQRLGIVYHKTLKSVKHK